MSQVFCFVKTFLISVHQFLDLKYYGIIFQLGKDPATKSDEFLEKRQRGRGVIFNPKIYVADFGNLK